MSEWCLQHPYLTFILCFVTIASISSTIQSIFKSKSDQKQQMKDFDEDIRGFLGSIKNVPPPDDKMH